MKFLIPLFVTWTLAVASSMADDNAVARCPVETGIFRDGGSQFMKIPAHGEQPSVEIILDRGINTTTPNEYYIAQNFHDKTRPMKVDDVLRAFKQAESVLLSKYGMEFIYHVAMNPLVVNGNVTEDEYVKNLSDPKFIERIDVSQVLGCIQQYRREHGTEQAGAEQPATRPESKSEGGDKEVEITLDMKLPKEMGGKDISISIKLLVPLDVTGRGNAGNDDGEAPLLIETCDAGDHTFAYTSEGDLYVDNFFLRRCEPSDDLLYGNGRFWANGKPYALMPMTDEQKRRFYGDRWQTSTQVAIKPCKLFLTPDSGWGGGEISADGSTTYSWTEGMTVVKFDNGSLYLHGICYGAVTEGDEVRVEYGIVKFNGKLRAPIQQRSIGKGEPAGADQPAAKPADKSPMKDQPSTQPSKDVPR